MTEKLKNEIFNFIVVNRKTESFNIVTYFNLRLDIVLTALKELEEEGRVKRFWSGCGYLYEVKND